MFLRKESDGKSASISLYRLEDILRLGRMRRPRPRPVLRQSGGGRRIARQDHDMPRHHSGAQKTRRAQSLPPLRNTRGHPLHGRRAAHEPLHGGVVRHLCDIPAIRIARRHPYLFDRRVLHRRDSLPGPLWENGARIRRHADGRSLEAHRNKGDGRHREQSLSGENSARHNREAR